MAEATAGHLDLVIVTPRGAVVQTEVTEIQAPGAAGEFGVLPGHIPFLAAIDPGVLSYVENGKPSVLAVGSGYVEVGREERVVVLTEASATPKEIDLAEVTREEQEAGLALAKIAGDEEKVAEQAHLADVQAWARARRETAERHRAMTAH